MSWRDTGGDHLIEVSPENLGHLKCIRSSANWLSLGTWRKVLNIHRLRDPGISGGNDFPIFSTLFSMRVKVTGCRERSVKRHFVPQFAVVARE